MVQVSEGSGGQVFLLDPSELASSATLLLARDGHDETLRRIVGDLDAGVRTVDVAVDTSVERVLFSVSLQCLQEIEIVRPSGAPVAASDPGVSWTAFQAGRQVGVTAPEPGDWKVRLAGKGLLFLVVHARSSLTVDARGWCAKAAGPATRACSATTRRWCLAHGGSWRSRCRRASSSPTFELRGSTDERTRPASACRGKRMATRSRSTSRSSSCRVFPSAWS